MNQERALTTNQNITHPAIITVNSKIKGLDRKKGFPKILDNTETQKQSLFTIFSKSFHLSYPEVTVV